jgi:NADPH:quinone reductase-like Zn-dependent oxidoreductase
MKAIVLKEYGGVDQLELREVPDPRPGPGEVRVKVAAASINPVDWKLRSGALRAFMPLVFPAVLGCDASGEVLELGPGATGLEVGDRVLGLLGTSGHTYAEQVVGPAGAFALLPGGLDLIDAAALPLVTLTGAELIDEAVQPRRGETVLVTGAVGGVGRTAVYAARQLGARVFAGVRARQKAEAAALGAEGVVAIDSADDIERLPILDAIVDTVGGRAVAGLLTRLKKGGTLGTVLPEPPEAKALGLVVRPFHTHPDAARLRKLAEAVARGALTIPIAKRMPLAEAREAQRLAEGGGVGKVLLTM